MDCEHGWRNAADCDTCTAIRVAPKAMDRIAELEEAARNVVWFDWSGNDADAVAAMERLRVVLGQS